MNNQTNQTSLKKNVVYNVAKTFFGIIFPLITFPYITRILSTESYGMYTFSVSIIGYIDLLAGLGISNYARREGARIRENNEELRSFIDQVFTISIITLVVAYLFLVFLIIAWRKLDAYRSIIFVLSVGTVFTTLGTDWINIIFEDYKYISTRYVICQTVSVMLIFLMLRSSNDVYKYAITSITGNVLANAMNIVYIRNKYDIHLRFLLTVEIRKHFASILTLFGTIVIGVIYINSDITILGIIRNDYDVAIYGFASKIYYLAKSVINAIVAVAIPRISLLVAKKSFEDVKFIIEEMLEFVLSLVFPISTGLVCLSTHIVQVISGDKYTSASGPLAVLAVSLTFAVVANIFINGILIPYRREKDSLIVLMISAVLNVVLNFILIPIWGANAAACTTLLSESFLCIGGFVISRKFLRINVIKTIFNAVLGAIIAGVISNLCKSVFDNIYAIIITSVALSMICFFIVLIIVKNNVVYRVFSKAQ